MSEKLSIESDAISFTSAEGGTFALTMRSAGGRYVTVTNEGQSKDPVVEGDAELAQSPAIVKNPEKSITSAIYSHFRSAGIVPRLSR